MSRSATTLDRLFDRSSRLPYPLRARTSPFRRWFMLSLFVVLSAVIGSYWYLTDARRVRDMAEQYLSQLSGAHVTVGRATLSIFEGLRLDDVRVYCQPPRKSDDLRLATGSAVCAPASPSCDGIIQRIPR